MQRANLNGADLEYEVQGSGEPLLLIHGSILADAYFALRAEPRIADHYRVISYHRRGFAGSSRANVPFTIVQQTADGRAHCSDTSGFPGRVSRATPMAPPSRYNGHSMPPPPYRVWRSLSPPLLPRFLRGRRFGKGSHPSVSRCMTLGTKRGRSMPS
jgi:pimeloyl-ACP methyl ester carboxylesterase